MDYENDTSSIILFVMLILCMILFLFESNDHDRDLVYERNKSVEEVLYDRGYETPEEYVNEYIMDHYCVLDYIDAKGSKKANQEIIEYVIDQGWVSKEDFDFE